jgi:hypothetical protein
MTSTTDDQIANERMIECLNGGWAKVERVEVSRSHA